MSTLQPRYSKEEFARRGGEIYERDIKPTLRPDDNGKFVAIDIESADYVIDQDDYTAVAPTDATVIWDGVPRQVLVHAMDVDPLLGTKLMVDHDLRMRMVPGGPVEIEAMP